MKFTDEQRLIVMMLADIQKHLGVQGDFNPDFVSKMAAYKDEFAIGWEHREFFDCNNVPDEFNFVIDVVDMWSFIEPAVDALSDDQRRELARRVGIRGENPRFTGFDGNNEVKLMSYTRILVEDLHRFQMFKGRDFNSHSPHEKLYGNMFKVFEPIRARLDRPMNLDELVEVLSAG